MADPSELARPTADEHYLYVRSFLLTLTVCFGVGGAGMLGYDAYTSGKAADARAALGEGEPSADQIKASFELVESPHLFSGWRVPDSIMPRGDEALSEIDEEALVKAVIEAPALPPSTKSSRAVGDCAGDLLCVYEGLGKPWNKKQKMPGTMKVHEYLDLRRTMAQGREMSPDQLRFFQWNRTLWVRAFRRQVMDGGAAPAAGDATMVRELIEIQDGATHNGTVFGWYGLVACLMFGGILVAWIRQKPDVDPAQELDESADQQAA